MKQLNHQKLLPSNLKRMRGKKGMTVEQMERLTGIRPVSRYLAMEVGAINLRLTTLLHLAEVLDMTPAALLKYNSYC